jgi:hypothetical protein
MARLWWSLVVFVTSVVALSFAFYTLRTSRVAHAATQRIIAETVEIPQPPEWVAFNADVIVTTPVTIKLCTGSSIATHTVVPASRQDQRAVR